MTRAWSPLERRLRRLALLIALLAIAAAVFGMFPDGVDLWKHSFKHDEEIADGTMRAGGWSLVAWAAAQVWAAWSTRTRPGRSQGVFWLAAMVAIDIAGGIAWLVENFRMDHEIARWPGHVTWVCVGTASVLALVVLPIVLLVSRGEPPSEVPTARVSA